MKKLILAFIALGLAFAISSCCDQSRCPGNLRCTDRTEKSRGNQEETPYRWDQPPEKATNTQQERQHRRW